MTIVDDDQQKNHSVAKIIQPEDPVIRPVRAISMFWLIPLVVALVGIWLVYDTLASRGPMIVITFHSAEGIEAGKTRVRHKAVDVGRVESVWLSPDFGQVELSVRLVRGTEDFLTDSAKFWVVQPRLSLQGVSGLGTLVSGTYIEMEPGMEGLAVRRFKGLENPPLVRSGSLGIKIHLVADKLDGLAAGSPVYYLGITAGEVLGFDLNENKDGVIVHAFIKSPYHKLIKPNSRFWKISGVNLSMDADGVRLTTASLSSLLLGGIAFETPQTLETLKPIKDGDVFTLFSDQNAVTESSYQRKIPYMMYFDGSVRGLKSGAPVEFQGIKVGYVRDIRMEFDRASTTFRVAVLVEIEPERVSESEPHAANDSPDGLVQTLVDRGLRGQLETANYLTGQLYVNLVMRPDTPLRLTGFQALYKELPTVASNLDEISASVTSLLKKLQTLPLDDIGNNLNETLLGLRKAVDAPVILEAASAMRDALVTLKSTMARIDGKVDPLGRDLVNATQAATQALASTERLMVNLNELADPDAPLNYRILDLTRELTATSRSIRTFVDIMSRQPEALMFGKDKQKE
ncbi:MAG: Mammalian cell entry related domain protein [Magnetococcales bacterium]|nr:Mammalian cell entry related domain protein [Magnetococcales bacterium]HIJ82606.1 MCE family protein [Magnetococcales bacterium]